MPEREQPEEQKRDYSGWDREEPATPDAELGRAYREAAEEMEADPLFDLDPNHGLPPSTENNW
ncbi:hypothetical protein DESA109040_20585 [Deinococcus saxicola]|uniref:hypothetical protein n=1 Tax=Deinococcus saxicola TaxID=249406 RepID=UPI0039EFDB3C